MVQKIRRYKFYFAAENEIDESPYVSEKVLDGEGQWCLCLVTDWPAVVGLYAGSVPVYFGPRNVEALLPCKNSSCIIFARDFSSPEKLAVFLDELAADEQRYARYHEWRNAEAPSLFVKGRSLCAQTFQCRLCNTVVSLNKHKGAKDELWYAIRGICTSQVHSWSNF